MRPAHETSVQSHCDLDRSVWSFLTVHKTEEELQAILAAKEEKLRLKAQRQNQQAENLQRKKELREAHKYAKTLDRKKGLGAGSLGRLTPTHSPSRKKSLAGIKRARARADGDSDAEDPGAPPEAVGASQPEDEEDDAEYFRQAVGEEPDEGVVGQGLLVTPGPTHFTFSEDLNHFSPYRLVPHSGQAETAGGTSGQEASKEGAEAW